MGMQTDLVRNSSSRGVFFATIPISSYSVSSSKKAVILHSGDDIYVRYFDSMPVASLLVSAGVPLLDFIEPSPKHLTHFSTVHDCPFQLILFANSSGTFDWKPSAEEQGKQFEAYFAVLDLKHVYYPQTG